MANKGDDVLVTTFGVMKRIAPMNGKHYTLRELQSYVGGCIETITFSNGKMLVVDEEGKFKNKLPNHIASGWMIADGYHTWIAGDAMLIDPDHLKNNNIL